MSTKLASLQTSVARHGLLKSLIRPVYTRVQKLIPFEICIINVPPPIKEHWPDATGYSTREVTNSEEFHNKLCAELADTNMASAFARKDICVASFDGEEIVGYNFWTLHSTQVAPGLLFIVPANHIYSYSARTAPSHRGKKLAPDRWKVAFDIKAVRFGASLPTIHYTDVMNLESRASKGQDSQPAPIAGYAAYVRLFGKWITFKSPTCKYYKTGFERSS